MVDQLVFVPFIGLTIQLLPGIELPSFLNFSLVFRHHAVASSKNVIFAYSSIYSNPFWHRLVKRRIKIEEYLQSRYSLGANKTSTSTKGVYGNNVPSVLIFS